jgi:hypothetical protein
MLDFLVPITEAIWRLLPSGLRCSVVRCQEGSVSQAVSKLLATCAMNVSCLAYSSILNIAVACSSETSSDFRPVTCVISQMIELSIKYTVRDILFTHLLPMFYNFKNYYVPVFKLNFQLLKQVLNDVQSRWSDNVNTPLSSNFCAVQWTGLTRENQHIIFLYGGYLTKYCNRY